MSLLVKRRSKAPGLALRDGTPLATPNQRRGQRLNAASIVAIGVGLVGMALAVLEHTDPAVRRWSVEHPITVAFITALVMVALTVFLLQRALDAAASRRWRMPAREALGMWLFAADEAARSANTAIMAAAEEAGPSDPVRNAADALIVLTREAPEALIEVSDDVREQARQLGRATSEASVVVPRCAELAPVTSRLFAAVSDLDRVADACRHLAWAHPIIDEAGTVPYEQAEEAYRRLCGVIRDAGQVRLYVMESRDRV